MRQNFDPVLDFFYKFQEQEQKILLKIGLGLVGNKIDNFKHIWKVFNSAQFPLKNCIEGDRWNIALPKAIINQVSCINYTTDIFTL